MKLTFVKISRDLLNNPLILSLKPSGAFEKSMNMKIFIHMTKTFLNTIPAAGKINARVMKVERRALGFILYNRLQTTASTNEPSMFYTEYRKN